MPSNVEKISIALTPEMAAEMRDVVARGEYASASEVIRDALRVWRSARAERAAALDEIGRLWDEGVDSGPAVDGEAEFAAIRNRLFAGAAKASD